jgi:hypothetical protein
MEFIVIIGLVTAFVWALVFLKSPVADALATLNPLHILALLVVVCGVVVGYDFFNIKSGPIPITIDRILFGGLVAWFGWRYLERKENLPRLNRLDVAVLCALGVLFWSTFSNDYTYRKNLPVSRLLFFHIIPVGLYFVTRSFKIGVREIKFTFAALGFLGLYLAVTGFAETRGWSWMVFPGYIMDSSFEEFFGRGRGPLLNPVSNGILQVVGICSVWCFWPKASGRVRILIVVLSLVLTIGIYSTLTRSNWMSLIFVAGLFIFLPSDQKTKGSLIICGTLALALLFPVIGGKLLSFKRDKDVSVSEMEQSAQLRPLFVIVAMNMFKDRPMLGCGFSHYPTEKYPYLQDPYSGLPVSSTRGYEQHNVFLAYLTETGLIGLTSLVLVLLLATRTAWLVFDKRQLPLEARQIGMVGGAIIICYVANGMFHDVSVTPMTNVFLYFVMGMTNNVLTAEHGFVDAEQPVTTAIQTAPHAVIPVPNQPARHGDLGVS